MNHLISIHRDYTPKSCVKECKAQGFIYASVQNGGECFCGDSYGKYGEVPETDCKMACQNDDFETCGGIWRNSVYKTGNLIFDEYQGDCHHFTPYY